MTREQSVSRRSFLHSLLNAVGASSVVAIGVSPNLLTFAPSAAQGSLDQKTFTSKLNSQFRAFFTPTQSVAMKLIAVKDLRTSAAQGEVFSILLETSAGQTFAQGTYTFKHNSLGTFDMFIVPASSSGPTRRYEAVFNHVLA